MHELTPLAALTIFVVGTISGTMNTIACCGTLLTFPTLLAFGYPALVANVSNTVGLVPGSISGAIGYRRELAGQRGRSIRLGVVAAVGGLTGGVLLLALPASTFQAVVPYLILFSCVLVALQPRLSRLMERSAGGGEHGVPLVASVFMSSVYGGYFGAAQGIILLSFLGIFANDDLQRLNALKIVLVTLVNGIAAVLFIGLAPVAWEPAVLIAVGSILGGQLGALVGRRLPRTVLRAVIIVVGTTVAVKLLLS